MSPDRDIPDVDTALMPEPIRAYLIDPFNETVSEVKYSGDYQDIYKLIDCETFTCVELNEHGDTVFVDDEGLVNGRYQDFFKLRGYPSPLAGKGLVLGTNEDGESVEPKMSLEALREQVQFIPGFAIGLIFGGGK